MFEKINVSTTMDKLIASHLVKEVSELQKRFNKNVEENRRIYEALKKCSKTGQVSLALENFEE